jgi:hypothetical protein
MPTTIRRATPDDADQIAEIIREVVAEPNPVAFDRERTPDEVRAWISRQGEHGAMFVVDDGRRIVAFAAMDFDSSRPDECVAFARHHGYKRIRARLPERNEPALSFLSSIGALVPLMSPGTSFELPIYQNGEGEVPA